MEPREEAYDAGFEDGKLSYWVANEWIEGPYAEYYWEGYEEALRIYFGGM